MPSQLRRPVRQFVPSGGEHERTNLVLPPVQFTQDDIREMEPLELRRAYLQNLDLVNQTKAAFFHAVRNGGRVSPRQHARYRARLAEFKVVEGWILSALGPDFIECRSAYYRCFRAAAKEELRAHLFWKIDELAKKLQLEELDALQRQASQEAAA